MEIRPADSEDVDALHVLQRSAHGEAWSRQVWLAELKRQNSSVWLVEAEKSEIAAFVVLWRVVDTLEVVDLAVSTEFRRQGIATTLVEMASALGAAMGVRRVALEVREDNEGACHFYRELGFVEAELLPGFYDDGTGARRLVRSLVAQSDFETNVHISGG